MRVKFSLLCIAGAMLAILFPRPTSAGASGVFANVPEAAEEGFVVLYELDPPVDSGFRNGIPVPYKTDNSATAPDFDRVAYYLELTHTEGTEWIYVSMDAFADDPKEVGLPHNLNNPVVHQRNVENMNVASNVPGIVTGTFMDTGHIEMWPSHYLTKDTYGVFEASHDLNDWGDGGGSTKSGYGSFQVHNPMARQTLLAYNGFGAIDIGPADIGIGTQPAGQPDWTGAGNADDYSERKLVILVRPRAFDVTFTDLPRNRQLISRDPATNRATVPIRGRESYGGHDRAVLRIYRNGVLHSEQEQLLTYVEGSAAFAFSPEILAELAKYDLEVLLEKSGELRTADLVRDVVAGDAFLFYGQSNAAAMSYDPDRSANDYSSEWLLTFGYGGDDGTKAGNILYWLEAEGDGSSADPGAIGQWAMVLGRELIDTYGVPIAILNGSRGGYSIDRLQKDRDDPDNLHNSTEIKRPYNRLRYRALKAGIAGTARAMFYYQGEHDTNDHEAHAAGFATLYEDWEVDYPALERIYVTQVRPGCGVTDKYVLLRDVQRRFADVYPRTSVMASNALPTHDGCHYLLAGYEQLGWHHFRKVARDLYGAPDGPDIDALNPAFVAFTDSTRTNLKVVLRNAGATVSFPAGAMEDFAIADSTATVVDRSVSGHTLYLELNRAVEVGSVLEYRSHLGEGEWITNANGVGLLTFAEPILSPEGITLSLSLADTIVPAEVGEPVEIEATSEGGIDSSNTLIVLYANGVPQLKTIGGVLSATWEPPVRGAYRLTARAYDADGEFAEESFTVLAGQPSTPGGVGNGLAVWLKAEAGLLLDSDKRVAEWQDQSGNHHHAVQETSSARPEYLEDLYGIGPGVHFGGSDFMRSGSGMPTGDYTKIVRFTITSDDTSFNHNVVSAPEAGPTWAPDHALFVPGLKPSLSHSGTFVESSRQVVVHQPATVAGTYRSGTREGRIYLDGTFTGTGEALGDNTKIEYQLGAYRTPPSHFLHGSIAEVILYNRVLNEGERQAVEEYLEEKFLTPFELWQRESFASGGDSSPAGDPDADGLPTILEYALGLDPAASDGAAGDRLPRIEDIGSGLEVTYKLRTDRPDVIVQLESSSDLQTWSVVEDEQAEVNNLLETRRHKIETLGGSLFFRLRAILP